MEIFKAAMVRPMMNRRRSHEVMIKVRLMMIKRRSHEVTIKVRPMKVRRRSHEVTIKARPRIKMMYNLSRWVPIKMVCFLTGRNTAIRFT